jgi:hypothetical protein
MEHRTIKLLVAAILVWLSLTGYSVTTAQSNSKRWSPIIPKAWNNEAIRTFALPVADSSVTVTQISSDYYYRMPVRPVYKSYSIYHPDNEPKNYIDWLKKQKPQITFDASKLKTKADWIKAGELVFDAPIEFVDSGSLLSEVRDRDWYAKNQVPISRKGILPFMRYVIREKGKVEVGILSCAMCHTRVMPDDTQIKGGQGNFPDDRTFAYENRLEFSEAQNKDKALATFRAYMKRNYAAPWLQNDPNSRPEKMTFEDIASVLEAIPPGVCARQGSSGFYPPRIPDLIGVRDRRYLDSSGLIRHRSIADFMRYAALNQGADYLSSFGDFRPKGKLPEPSEESRYSDEQLYALALYVYSLKPPPNPNRFDAQAKLGKRVFEREGCGVCHTPPLYTNNKLTPAAGFNVPADHLDKYDIMPVVVGTDSRLTTQSRRGTGYYKVPSLKGLWYRGPIEHNGSVATLEDWFNPQRLQDDYQPTGFRGYGVDRRAVKGHLYGLALSARDRKALIAFLQTL